MELPTINRVAAEARMPEHGFYRFALGDFTCVSLCDGYHDYAPSGFFANAPREHVEEALRASNLPLEYVRTPYTYLYVDTGNNRVLVDIGAGDIFPTTGRLVRSMQDAGILPLEIDTVAITHAHPDHIGGALDEQGNLVFPNARYYISRREWEFWHSDDAAAVAPEKLVPFIAFARKHLAPMKGQVVLVDGESELVPGIRAIPAPGHTPGHMIIEVASREAVLWYIGDTVLHPLHLAYPNWLPVYDALPEEAAPSKHTVFDRAARESILVIGQHFPPFPSLGHILKGGRGWRWLPIEVA
jgi:glyoxylase-like metal-dependent hydrolase (beta-lactamase superfamily II)